MAGHTDQVGTCVDGTSSSASFYAGRFQSQVAAAVVGWATRPPATLGAGAPGAPGLHIVVRSVTTTSNSTDYPSVNDEIPAVTMLAPVPAATDPNYSTDLRTWLAAKPGWLHVANAAISRSSAVAAEVRHYPVARNTHSAVFSCLSGAATELAPAPQADLRLVELSDFENNEPAVGLALSHAHVLLVTICPANAAAGCPQRFASFSATLRKAGAVVAPPISADALTVQDLISFWRS
jgi:hypothetical protein